VSGAAPGPLTPRECARLAALLDVLVAFCDHSPAIMELALWRHFDERLAYDVDELRADLDMYACSLRGRR